MSELLSGPRRAEPADAGKDSREPESGSEPLQGDRPRCILVLGPESAGNHLAMEAMQALGCAGSITDVQPFDKEQLPLAEPGRPIMWGHSAPTNLDWPSIERMASRARNAGYEPYGLVPIRGWLPMTKSQIARARVVGREQAESNIRYAIEHIATGLRRAATPWAWLLFEELLQRPEPVMNWLAWQLGLERTGRTPEIRGTNSKHWREEDWPR